MERLALPAQEGEAAPAPTAQQADEIRAMQSAAAEVAKLQKAQEEARRIYVGYELRSRASFTGGVVNTIEPVTFDPYAGPPGMRSYPSGAWIAGVEVEVQPYEKVKGLYDQASDAIAGFLAAYPALYAVSREGKSETTAAFAGIASPAQAREELAKNMRALFNDIEETQTKLDAGDLDPLDLTPVHAQLLGGTAAPSGTRWNEALPRQVVQDLIKGHEFTQALKALGLQTAAMALFMLAPLTGGASLYVMLAGLAVTGAKYYLSEQQYEQLAQASKTGATPGTELVTGGQVEQAKMIADADAIALALAVLAVGVAAAAKIIGAIKGPPVEPEVPPESRVDPKQFGIDLANSLKGQAKGKFFVVCEKITEAQMSQADAVTAASSATEAMGNRLVIQPMPNGDVVLASVMPGTGKPILVVRPNGSMYYASADLAVNMGDPKAPFIITNIQPK
jgi:hypothetical protein